ncbi:MAG: hypothetical protein KDD50_02765 [Bdellovibrionales bacterium]|nr:hypothetical protein [Bdellovibrionales bacterium]
MSTIKCRGLGLFRFRIIPWLVAFFVLLGFIYETKAWANLLIDGFPSHVVPNQICSSLDEMPQNMWENIERRKSFDTLQRPLTNSIGFISRKAELEYLALGLAQQIYDLPDLSSFLESSFVRQFSEFESDIETLHPKVVFLQTDRKSGAKFAILYIEHPEPLWVIVLAGTEDLQDWWANSNYGLVQLQALRPLIEKIGTCPHKLNLLITGHSLGGGLAQALGASIEMRRINAMKRPHSLQVVSWNGFGAKKLVEDFSGSTVSTRRPNFVNYYIAGDPVSRLNVHLGSTFQIKSPHWSIDPIYIHSMKRFVEALPRSQSLMQAFEERAPDRIEDIDKWTVMSPLFLDQPAQVYAAEKPIHGLLLKILTKNVESYSPLLQSYIRNLRQQDEERESLIFLKK